MKKIIFCTSLLIVFTFKFCISQNKNDKGLDSLLIIHLDSIMIQSKSPSYSRLGFIHDCENAKLIAEKDIKNKTIYLLIQGGIAPVVYSNDSIFEKKYNISYYDYGCVAAKEDCILNYNMKIFDYLNNKYGKNWYKEVRKDIAGLREWKKRKKKTK